MNTDRILAVADAIEQHTIPELGFNMRFFTVRRGNHLAATCVVDWTV